jgi:selenocysteine-specific elongation factor
MFVLGTAGHIDHGKSVLVRALSGIDPDRLREEKERGMTIDLGFAWFTLPSGREVGVVDVPGHERFIKNMLAGVGGIDLALLIVAANESVMPQTREHLAILDILEVRHGVVAVTKQDLVDDEWLSLVKMEVEELIAPTTLAGAPIVAVSARTGEGLPELLAAIDEQLDKTIPPPERGRPRLPVDRVFTIAGAGTVVTGTLTGGSLKTGQEVAVIPAGLKTRLRGLQTHKAGVTEAQPGSRVAANLVGLSTSQVKRGDVITLPGWLKPTTLVSARCRLLDSLPRPLRHNTEVSFFSGAAEILAKMRLLEGNELLPGGEALVQFLLEAPLALADGDHFIIRSPDDTLGGGHIIEARAKRVRRSRAAQVEKLRNRAEGGPEATLLSQLEKLQPSTTAQLAKQGEMPPETVSEMLGELISRGEVVAVGEGAAALLWTLSGWEDLTRRATATLAEYHKKFPVRVGMPRKELAGKLKSGAELAAALERLAADGAVAADGDLLRLSGHEVRLTAAQQAGTAAFLKSLTATPYNPSSELIPEPELLGLLAAQGKVERVSASVVYDKDTYDAMVVKIIDYIKANGRITLPETRDLFGTSRKYAQAILEYLDGQKITKRVGDDRVLR